MQIKRRQLWTRVMGNKNCFTAVLHFKSVSNLNGMGASYFIHNANIRMTCQEAL